MPNEKDVLVSDDGVFKVYRMNPEDLAKVERTHNGVTTKLKNIMRAMEPYQCIDVPKDKAKEATVRNAVHTYNSSQKASFGKDAAYFSVHRDEGFFRVVRQR